MSNVSALPGALTPQQARAYTEAGQQVAAAIRAAKAAGVWQGLIVSMLHGYAHRETAEMMEQA